MQPSARLGFVTLIAIGALLHAPPLLAVQAFAPLDEEVRKILAQLGAKVSVIATGSTVRPVLLSSSWNSST